jgi:triacylglycerol lipase
MEYINHCHKMAKMAGIAYLDGEEAKVKYAELGYTDHVFIEDTGAQCHAVWNENEFVLCFRGTEPDEFSDIKADLNAFPDRGQSGGWVHNGFQEELNKIWDEIDTVLHNQKGKNFFICGHSLGGAMATLAASRLKESVECLYTYGSPRVGTKSFVKSFNVPHYRHVNNNDIVPKVPFAFLGYRHHGTLRYINFYGNIRKMTPWQRFKDGWRGRKAAWKNKAPFDGARDHGMDNYIKYTEKN